MRSAEEIEAQMRSVKMSRGEASGAEWAKLVCELLLDIRTVQMAMLPLLDTRPPATYPKSPPAPEVG